MLANLKMICQFHAHSVNQNSVEICWAEIYRGRLLTLINGSSSRLLRIQCSADLSMYWFSVCYFRCMKFKPLVIWIWNQNIAISTIVGTSSLWNQNIAISTIVGTLSHINFLSIKDKFVKVKFKKGKYFFELKTTFLCFF